MLPLERDTPSAPVAAAHLKCSCTSCSARRTAISVGPGTDCCCCCLRGVCTPFSAALSPRRRSASFSSNTVKNCSSCSNSSKTSSSSSSMKDTSRSRRETAAGCLPFVYVNSTLHACSSNSNSSSSSSRAPRGRSLKAEPRGFLLHLLLLWCIYTSANARLRISPAALLLLLAVLALALLLLLLLQETCWQHERDCLSSQRKRQNKPNLPLAALSLLAAPAETQKETRSQTAAAGAAAREQQLQQQLQQPQQQQQQNPSRGYQPPPCRVVQKYYRP